MENMTNSGIKSETSKRRQTMWKSSLQSASRTALACIIVEAITLYTPYSFKNHFAKFPTFSYFTVVLMVTNATLGDAVRGCCLALCATIQSVGPAILCLWITDPTRLRLISTTIVLFICAFFVALPEWTHVVAKRIALGQLVLVYVVGYVNKEQTEAIMHPIHVAASTSLGAFAGLLAMLLPYPHLAFFEVQESSKLFTENASERLKLFVKAFCAEDGASSQTFISQATCLAPQGRKFLQCIKFRQDSMHWERFPVKFLRPYYTNPLDGFQELETYLRGIEIAAVYNSQVHFPILDERLKDEVNKTGEEISQNIQQIRNNNALPCKTLTVPESEWKITTNTLPNNSDDHTPNLSSYFFLFCMKLLYSQSRVMSINPSAPKADQKRNSIEKTGLDKKQVQHPPQHHCGVSWPDSLINRKRLIPALKCSLSLTIAVVFGLYYSKSYGIWAGLPIAIGLAAVREPTFKVTSTKFQGTALGSVYGLLGCFVFHQYFPRFKFLALFPWFVFTGFLQQSKMYGQAGAVCSVVGAVLILGRENYGPPTDFAIARIVETFIGLFCSIMVELVLQPTRGATLAKAQLSRTLASVQMGLGSINYSPTNKTQMLEWQSLVEAEVVELEKYVSEAEIEPNFWFLPFHGSCYRKLVSSLGKMADLLLFIAHANNSLQEQFQRIELLVVDDGRKGVINDEISGDFVLIKNATSSSMKCLQEISSIESLKTLEKKLGQSNKSYDVEMGKSGKNKLDSDKIAKIMNSLLDHFKEIVETFDQLGEDEEEEKEMKSQVVMSLSALGFCLNCLMNETNEVEKEIKELLQWENPTSHINLNEISCKIHALYN